MSVRRGKRQCFQEPPHTWDRRDNLSNLQSVQDCGFSSTVQTQDQDPHLPGAEEAREETGEEST